MRGFNISGISFLPELWEPEKNLERLLAHTDEAAAKGAQVIGTTEGILDCHAVR